MTRWWAITALWLVGVAMAAASVLIVSHAKGGLLAARPAARLESLPARAPAVDLEPLRAEIAACRAEVAEVRWQLEALLPTAWPGRERAPVLPRGAKPPRPRQFPAAGSARLWKRGGW